METTIPWVYRCLVDPRQVVGHEGAAGGVVREDEIPPSLCQVPYGPSEATLWLR